MCVPPPAEKKMHEKREKRKKSDFLMTSQNEELKNTGIYARVYYQNASEKKTPPHC